MRTVTTLITGVVLLAQGPTATAQGQSARTMEEVIVRAQHRDSSLKDTPLAISVFDSNFLADNRLQRLESIVLATPNFSGWEQGVSTPIFAIRGISSNSFGIGGEASVGFFVNDTYRGRINSTAITLVDVEQVEVLKGPQGTLFGRNASAGAILVRHFRPDQQPGLSVQMEAGENDYLGGYATGNLPLNEHWAVRGSVFSYDDDGDADNLVADEPIGDRDTEGVQLALGYNRGRFDAVLRASYQETHSGGLGYETLDDNLAAAGGVTANPFDSVLATDIDTFDDIESSDVSLHLTWELVNGMTLKSITAWHENDSPNDFDVDGSAIFLTSAGFSGRNSETLSQELRLSGTNGRFDWVLGGIVFDESIDTTIELGYSDVNLLADTPLCSPAFAPVFGPCQDAVHEVATQEGDYFSAGLYGDVNWQISDRINVGVGLRYSYDDKDFDYRADPVTSVIAALNASELNPAGNLLGYSTDGVESLQEDWDDWQPRFYASFQLTPRHTVFANAAKGFKAGGFDPEPTRQLSIFDPEEVWNFDMGIRGDFVEQRVRYQLSAFLYDYEDYQVQVIENGIAQTGNVDGVDGQGVELELSWIPFEGLTLGATAAWLDAEFKRTVTDTGDLKGNRPVLSPEYAGSLTLNWRSPRYRWGSVGLNWLSAWQDEVFFSVQNLEEASQDSYWRHDARLSWFAPSDKWRVDLFGRNLANEDYVIFQDDVGAGLVSRRGEPRFVGAAVNYSL